MKKILGGLALLCMAAAVGSATPVPACGSSIGNVVNLNSGGGCAIGGLTFSSFAVLIGSSGTGTAEIDLVSATVSGNDITLNFNPSLGTGTIGGTITDLHFSFLVAGPIKGADLQGADLNVGGQFAAISEQICTVYPGMNGGCSQANLLFNAAATSGQSGTCAGDTSTGSYVASVCNFGAGADQGYVFKDISLGNLSGGHLTSFDESFMSGTGVPEPTTISLMGLGLVGLGLIGRRRKV